MSKLRQTDFSRYKKRHDCVYAIENISENHEMYDFFYLNILEFIKLLKKKKIPYKF